MSKLIEIQAEIAKLQQHAAAVKAKEYDATIADIRAKMAAYGITIRDLQSPIKGKRGQKAKVAGAKPLKMKKAKSGATVAAKYCGPNGEMWSGRGLTPKWMAALIEAGQTKESFLISQAQATVA